MGSRLVQATPLGSSRCQPARRAERLREGACVPRPTSRGVGAKRPGGKGVEECLQRQKLSGLQRTKPGTYDTTLKQAARWVSAELVLLQRAALAGAGWRPNETALHKNGVGASAKALRIIAIHTACHVLHNRHAGGDHAGCRGAATTAADA